MDSKTLLQDELHWSTIGHDDQPLRELKAWLLDRFILPDPSFHGPEHWLRVRFNGLLLAPLTGADRRVVELFSLTHDICRLSEGRDREHGPRAARLVLDLQHSGRLPLDAAAAERLVIACRDHSFGYRHDDPTIATCWDADRLDLPRVGITVRPERLCTEAASDPALIQAARHRALADVATPPVRIPAAAS